MISIHVFFHTSATSRSKVNRIKKLQDDGSITVDDPILLKVIAKNYFKDLFMHRHGFYSPILEALRPCVSFDDNAALTRPFSKLEIFTALNQMHVDKSPSPDGFNPAFYNLGSLW